MKVHYSGVRRWIPVPGDKTLRTGGNTPCVSIELHARTLIVIDAGTGNRSLGRHPMTVERLAAGRGRSAMAKVAYLSDTGPWAEVLQPASGQRPRETAESYYWDHVILAVKDADLVAHDTFFQAGRYEACSDSGHSAPGHAVHPCRDAGARQLYLFHFPPDREGDEIHAMVLAARELAGPIEVAAVVEGMEVVLPGDKFVPPSGRSQAEGSDQA